MPDEELARRLGRTPGAIEARRVAFGIVMFGHRAGSRARNRAGVGPDF